MDKKKNHLGEVLKEMLDARSGEAAFREAVKDYHPSDIAEAIDDLPEESKGAVIEMLDARQAGEVLDEAGEQAQEDFVEDASVEALGEIVDTMPPDEAADILEHADEEKAEAVISKLEPEHAKDVRELMKYDAQSAGGIMTTDFFSIASEEAASEVLKRIKNVRDSIETLEEIFVLGENSRLLGVIGVMDLIVADANKTAKEFMDKAVVTVSPGDDQELCARLMQKYDLAVLPVVGVEKKMLGIITVDDILEVMSDEASEDMYRLAGVGESKPLEHSPLRDAYKRLPWFAVSLVGLSALSVIISIFRPTLQSIMAVSFFIPAIMGLGGNVGIQSSTITVRGLAMGELDFNDFFWLLRREVIVALVIGTVCSLTLGGASWVMLSAGILGEMEANFSVVKFAITIAIAMFCGIIAAVLMGTSIPMLCHRFGVDPAIASGPFVTTLIDICTQVIYLTLATLILMN